MAVAAEKSASYSLEAVKAVFVTREHALNISYFPVPVGKSRATFFFLGTNFCCSNNDKELSSTGLITLLSFITNLINSHSSKLRRDNWKVFWWCILKLQQQQAKAERDLTQFATLQINAKLAAASELRSGDEAEDEAEDEYVVTHVNEEVAARYYEFLLKEEELEKQSDDDENDGPSSPQEADEEKVELQHDDQEDDNDAKNIDETKANTWSIYLPILTKCIE